MAVSSFTLAGVLLLAGCASVPPPDGAMNQAQSQLQAARDAGAGDYAPVDLGFAQDKFQQAQAAMAGRKYEQAAALASEAQADAELAQAKARLGSARSQIQSRTDENGRLRAQLEQARQDAQNAANAATPAPAGSSSAPETLQDMPAPSSSVLGAPLPPPSDQPVPASSIPQGDQP
ncbi:DUF4398 domain-containing protein [Frateuria defendens]|uniref:DUF4398 domain-containing protein n=1 Tax=Frateuria defendens TaxID=2219559 RepID=UPI001F2A2576|nr:DUF4398 domain-containing protein [Frateuria defendens]